METDRPFSPHGGASFEAIGVEFDALDRRAGVISADVLDAWYPPAPEVLEIIERHLPWIVQTSPPAHSDGMISAIAGAREIDRDGIAVGAGSSALMYDALPRLIDRSARVLLIEPTYSEYGHLIRNVLGCRVIPFETREEDAYSVDVERLQETIARHVPDLVVIVNPNNPTGGVIPREELLRLIDGAPAGVRFWVDETYIDFLGRDRSIEREAPLRRSLIVCTSMSKVYALSGLRAGYLCADPDLIRDLRRMQPPWNVGLPAQIAAVAALRNREYYAARIAETDRLREVMAATMTELGFRVAGGGANFLLLAMPEHRGEARELLRHCRGRGLYLRDVAGMGAGVNDRHFRMAVKDAVTNGGIAAIVRDALRSMPAVRRASPIP